MKRLKLFSSVVLFIISMTFNSSCSKDDKEDDIDTTPISLYVGDQKEIQGAKSLSSANDFIAVTKDNTIEGFHVGKTRISVNNSKSIDITVKSIHNLYDDPVCNWGCTMNEVRQKQTQGKYSSRSDNDALIYENAGGASFIMYSFNNGKLKSVGVVVSTNHLSQFTDYLLDRFLMTTVYYGKDTYFAGIDGSSMEIAKTFVMMEVYNVDYMIALYTPVSKTPTRSAQDTSYTDEIIKEIKNRLQL